MKYGIYRAGCYMQFREVKRGGKPVQFKTKKECKNWIKNEKPASADPKVRFFVKKIIKEVA